MPRIPRLSIAGVPLHVVQRGNNRQPVFFSEEDYRDYLRRLFDGAARYDVSVHAFVCMTNHVHLLLTPWQDRAVSRMMQWLGSGYTAAVNATYHRTGSLWKGQEQYECSIEHVIETSSTIDTHVKTLLGPKEKLALSNYTESELSDMIYKAVLSEPELKKYDSYVQTNARLVAAAAKC